MVLSKEQLDALLATGKISSDWYDSIVDKSGKEQVKAMKDEGKQAQEDLRLAENNAHTTPPGYGALGSGGGMPVMPPMPPPNMADWATPPTPKPPPPPQKNVIPGPGASLEEVLAASNNKPPAPVAKPINVPPAAPPTDPLPKTPLNLDQVVGAKPATPADKNVATVATPTGPLKVPMAAGYPNPYAGPTDQEKFMTPGERARKTELVEEGNLRKDLTSRGVDLQMNEDKQMAELQKKQAMEYKSMVEGQAAIRAEENRLVQQNLDMLNQESKELGQKKIDPNRAWNNANKPLAILGMFLGAGGTRKGGANPAVAEIEKHIDRDIQAQEFDIKNQGLSIDQRKGLLQDRVKQFGNNELARVAAKKDYLDVVEMNAKALLAGNQSEKTRLKGDDLLASLQEAKDKTMFDFSQLNDQRSRQLAAQSAAAQAAANAKLYEDYKARRDSLLKVNEDRIKAGLAPLDPTQMTGNKSYDYQPSNPEFAKNKNTSDKDLRERSIEILGPDGKPRTYVGRDNKAADTIGEAEVAKQRLKALIKEAKELRAENGGEMWPTAAKKRMQQINGEMLAEVKSIDKLGTLDAGVERLGEKIIPDLTDWNLVGDDTVLTQLDGLEKKADRNLETVLRSNAVPGSMGPNAAQLGAVKNK